jgi:hypothetical protein
LLINIDFFIIKFTFNVIFYEKDDTKCFTKKFLLS